MDFKSGQVLKFLSAVFLLGVAFSQSRVGTKGLVNRFEEQVGDYDYPSYSEENLPETSFSCKDKTNGGYYADIETDCQMYHVCSKDKFGTMRSTRFLCGNGTVFDQRHLVCQDYRRVQRCRDSAKYYRNAASILELLERYDYSPFLENPDLPETSFSCKDKSNGGHYADIETDCTMYHVCSKDKFGIMRSTRFQCGNGTAFDQRYHVCQDIRKVHRCEDSERFYRYPSHIFRLTRG